jgi:DNA-binding CsgD family transcriptional regulator
LIFINEILGQNKAFIEKKFCNAAVFKNYDTPSVYLLSDKYFMKKTLLIYGLFLGLMSIVLKTTEYWFWVKLNAFDLYGGLIALIFLGAGIWLGIRFNEKKKEKETLYGDKNSQITEGVPIPIDEKTLGELGISKREYEVLTLLGKGMSNQEIADALFISQNTVKTHTSRLFEKLEVRNRTHAILKSKELGIISA